MWICILDDHPIVSEKVEAQSTICQREMVFTPTNLNKDSDFKHFYLQDWTLGQKSWIPPHRIERGLLQRAVSFTWPTVGVELLEHEVPSLLYCFTETNRTQQHFFSGATCLLCINYPLDIAGSICLQIQAKCCLKA